MAPGSPSIADQKTRLRRQTLASLKTQPFQNAAGAKLVSSLSPWIDAAKEGDCWALFASLPWEIDLAVLEAALIKRGLTRLFPAIDGDALDFKAAPPTTRFCTFPVGRFGVRTPSAKWRSVALSTCTVIVTPGVCFGQDGTRLGYGRGFYDRAIAGARRERNAPTIVGVGFDDQLLPTVPVTSTDEAMDAVVLPRGVVFRAP